MRRFLSINGCGWIFFLKLVTSFLFNDNEPFLLDFNASIRFLELADFGGIGKHPYVSEGQVKSVFGLNKVAQTINAEFVIGLGDLFYDNGVKNVNDKRFDITWKDVYLKSDTKCLHVPWYLIAGK